MEHAEQVGDIQSVQICPTYLSQPSPACSKPLLGRCSRRLQTRTESTDWQFQDERTPTPKHVANLRSRFATQRMTIWLNISRAPSSETRHSTREWIEAPRVLSMPDFLQALAQAASHTFYLFTSHCNHYSFRKSLLCHDGMLQSWRRKKKQLFGNVRAAFTTKVCQNGIFIALVCGVIRTALI